MVVRITILANTVSSGKIILVLQVVAHQEYQSCFVIGRYCVSYLVVYSLLIFAFYSFGPLTIEGRQYITLQLYQNSWSQQTVVLQ